MLGVRRWLPGDVYEWMKALPPWYEDEYAILSQTIQGS